MGMHLKILFCHATDHWKLGGNLALSCFSLEGLPQRVAVR